ncbi:hypothetical protein ACIBO5_41005 [Nonomuraea angiospora]|uniref:hypothetical protein n=1 Tax=Nonomuraea angiospora TaxID=46172 RepID=UPI0037B42ADD
MAVGGPQVRSLLAMLLLEAGRPVSVGRPAPGLYGEAAPPADPASRTRPGSCTRRCSTWPVSDGERAVSGRRAGPATLWP